MTAMPGSRIFVGLAEEYRRAGRYEDALNTLKKGLESHPTYLSAQIALARLYQETWRTQEAIDAFSKVLAMDRENLVAAKALSELYESSQNPVEAIKKLKLYRAISGDRSIDDKIGRMEESIHLAEEPAATMALRIDDLSLSPEPASAPPFDPNETVNVMGAAVPEYPAPLPPAEEAPLAEKAPPAAEAATPPPSTPSAASGVFAHPLEGEGGTPESRDGGPGEGAAALSPEAHSIVEELEQVTARDTTPSDAIREPHEAGPEPGGQVPASRTLADLYYKQGFIDDARKIYEKLAVANPMDESVSRRLRVLRKPSRRKAARLESWLAGVRTRAARAGRA